MTDPLKDWFIAGMETSGVSPIGLSGLRARIREARNARELSQRYVADRLGVSPQAVSGWEREGAKDSPTIQNLIALCGVLGVRLQWLLEGLGPKDASDANVTAAAIGATPVPHIDAVTAGHWGQVVSQDQRGQGREFIYTSHKVSVSAFALSIVGRSMEPDFLEGDIIIVDPEVTAQPGDFVVAKLDNEDTATFKKYRPRGNDQAGKLLIDLVPLNEDWPTLHINVNSPGRIVGVMVEHRRLFRRR